MTVSLGDELFGLEYEKTRQLLVFQKLCKKMDSSKEYEMRIRTLLRQSRNEPATIMALMKNEYKYDLDLSDAQRMARWVKAHLAKLPTRKAIPQDLKAELVGRQSGKCAICGRPVDAFSSSSHVDHVIPWVLVGDELEDNYQVLCDDCNVRKSSDVAYVFKSMLKLN